MGFDLLFDFRPNPFFTNTKLIKRYVIDILPDRHDYVIAPHHDVAILDNLSEEWDADCEGEDCVVGDVITLFRFVCYPEAISVLTSLLHEAKANHEYEKKGD